MPIVEWPTFADNGREKRPLISGQKAFFFADQTEMCTKCAQTFDGDTI
jgi:hypothetical protein